MYISSKYIYTYICTYTHTHTHTHTHTQGHARSVPNFNLVPNLLHTRSNTVVIDTEGMLAVSDNENERKRLLLRVP